jgi:hypothetical protein
MKRLLWSLLAAAAAFLVGAPIALSDHGQASPTLSFFSGGGGAHADWLATSDQPPGDTDNQAIRLLTTTASNGFAGILVHHVAGIPAASFPDSSFWLKAPRTLSLGPPSVLRDSSLNARTLPANPMGTRNSTKTCAGKIGRRSRT